MDMYEGIKERIMRKLPELSSGQLAVAHFLLERMPEAAFMTAGELAEEVGVSESTVVRFASAIGYDGYPEMRQAIQEVMVEQFSPEYEHRKYLEATGKGESLGKRVMGEDLEALTIAVNKLEQERLDQLVNMIVESDFVYISGFRSAFSLAYYLHFYLSWFLPNLGLLVGDFVKEQLVKSSYYHKKPLVLGISFHRYAMGTYETLKFAKSLGIKTALISNSLTSSTAQHSDLTITVPCNAISFVVSYTTAMSLLNALIVSIAAKIQPNSQEILYRLEDVWSEGNTYAGWTFKKESFDLSSLMHPKNGK